MTFLGNLKEFLSFVRDALIDRGLSISITQPFSWTGYKMPPKYTYFSEEESKGLNPDLMAMLDIARGKAGVPFFITCGLRTAEQNSALKNSVSNSSHLTGHAVDLACADSPTRFAMLSGLLQAGFNRIGIYSAHIHVDNDSTKPSNVCWYVAGT